MIRLSLRAIALTVSALAVACGGSEGPTEPPAPVVTSVTVSPPTAMLETAGATVQLQATARDGSGNTVTGKSVTWSTSATAVATVSTSGLVTAVAPGSANITATVAGVAGSAAVTIPQPPPSQACENPTTVTLAAGQAQSFSSSTCIVLPSGASGDRYRVVVLRTGETGEAGDVRTATLKVTGVGGVSGAPPAATPSPLVPQILPDVPGLSRTEMMRAVNMAEATERFHVELRRREEQMLRTMPGLVLARTPSRPAMAAPAQATSPEKVTLDASTTCSTPDKKTAIRVYENDDLVLYQDSTQRVTKPIEAGPAQQLLDHYSLYGKKVVEDYFGKPSDIDGNGKVVVFASPVVESGVAAFVWSGDFFRATGTGGCAASNEREIIYFSTDLIVGLAASSGNFQALETMAHEMKHVVSLYHRIAASLRIGSAQYHPTWIEEGTAEIAGEMSSRTAWAANGGPAVGSRIVRQNWTAITRENYGVAIKLARAIGYLSSQPNGLVITPTGAGSGSSIYGSGWLFHRWLGDAFGGAATAAYGDAAMFRALNDSMSNAGTAGIVFRTGRSWADLVDEFAKVVALHGTPAPAPALDIKTYDFVSAAEIFCSPNPVGVFPWPVTTTGTPGDCDANPRVTEVQNPSASFATRDYTGPIGPTGMRVHDFLSNGTGTGARIELSLDAPSKLWVVRLR